MAGKKVVKAVKDGVNRWSSAFRLDSWENLLTGLGTLFDKSRWTVPRAAAFLDEQTLEALFINDPWARRIVEDPVKAAFRQGFELVSSGMWIGGSQRAKSKIWYEPERENEKRENLAIRAKLVEFNAINILLRLFIFGRLWGREAILLGFDDGQDLEEPLNIDTVRDLRYLELIDRIDFYPATYQNDPSKPCYGEPETWGITRAVGITGQPIRVHTSRMIMAGGDITSRRKRMENAWCDASVLQVVVGQLQRFNSDDMSVSSMMQDCSQAVLKINNFADILAGEDKDTLRTRMEIIDRGRSVSRIMPIDAQDEEFEYIERSFAGVHEIMERRQQLLAGSASRPVTLLFGREPAGLSATGEADIRAWYDTVHAERVAKYEPLIVHLVQLIAAAIGVEQPTSWGIQWPSLWQESPEEFASRQKSIADSDAVYISQGVLDPEEVSEARYGLGMWSDRAPTLDMDGRAALREQDIERTKGKGLTEEEVYGVPADKPTVAVEVPADVDVAKKALNGAQTAALIEKIIQTAALGEIPRESAIQAIMLAYPAVGLIQAEALMADIGKGFVPASQASIPKNDGMRCDPDVSALPPKESKGSMIVQSVTLPGDWTKEKAVKWLHENKYRAVVSYGRQGAGSAEEGEEKRWRARQFNPEHFVEGSFKKKVLDNGGILILGKVK